MGGHKAVEFNREKYLSLKKRYNEAVRDHEHEFTFEGDQYVTDYAKYLLQYLSLKFEKNRA